MAPHEREAGAHAHTSESQRIVEEVPGQSEPGDEEAQRRRDHRRGGDEQRDQPEQQQHRGDEASSDGLRLEAVPYFRKEPDRGAGWGAEFAFLDGDQLLEGRATEWGSQDQGHEHAHRQREAGE